MKNLENEYSKLFDELIPDSKEYGFSSFSKSVNVKLFLKDLRRIKPKSYKLILKNLISKREIINLIGYEILEAYFLSKNVLKNLKRYEKKNFFEKKFIRDEIILFKKKQ